MLVQELMIADDCALATYSEEDAQILMGAFAHSAEQYELTISLKKTAVLTQPKPDIHHTEHPSEPNCTQDM